MFEWLVVLCSIIFGLIVSIFTMKNTKFKVHEDTKNAGFVGGKGDNIMKKKKRHDGLFDYIDYISYFSDKDYNSELVDILDIEKSSNDIIILYDDINKKLPYKRFNDYNIRTTDHIGQLKLLLSELQFLTDALKEDDKKHTDEILFVYAGSAPCNHMFMIEKLFPNIKFLFVDPNEHCVYYENPSNPDYYKDTQEFNYVNNDNITTHYNEKYIDKFLYFKLAKGNRFSIPNRKVNCYHINKIVNVERDNYKKLIEINADHTEADLLKNLFQTNHKYYVIEDYFTNDLAMTISKVMTKLNKKIYFCSDIRSQNEENEPGDLEVIWDSLQQYNWLKILENNIYKATLKFRTPFHIEKDKKHVEKARNITMKSLFKDAEDKGLDVYNDYMNNKFTYLKGVRINIQSFPPTSSTETRLIVSPDIIQNNVFEEYDSREFEDKLFYYNRIIRPYKFMECNDKYKSEFYGIDNCQDCSLMIHIIRNYYEQFKIINDGNELAERVRNDIIYIIKVLGRRLNVNLHGIFNSRFKSVSDVIKKEILFVNEGLLHKYKQSFKKPNKNIIHSQFNSSKKILDMLMKILNLKDATETLTDIRRFETLYKKDIEMYREVLIINIMLDTQLDRSNVSKIVNNVISIYQDKTIKDKVHAEVKKDHIIINTGADETIIKDCVYKPFVDKGVKITEITECLKKSYNSIKYRFSYFEPYIIEDLWNINKHKNVYEIVESFTRLSSIRANLGNSNLHYAYTDNDNQPKLNNYDLFLDTNIYKDDMLLICKVLKPKIVINWIVHNVINKIINSNKKYTILLLVSSSNSAPMKNILHKYNISFLSNYRVCNRECQCEDPVIYSAMYAIIITSLSDTEISSSKEFSNFVNKYQYKI
jgi:hypothetical protein